MDRVNAGIVCDRGARVLTHRVFGGRSNETDALVDYIADQPNKGDIWLSRGVGTLQDGLAPFVDGGIGTDKAFLADPQRIVGKEGGDKAFMSCSQAKGSGFQQPVMFNIYCPDGVKMTFAEPYSHFKGGNEAEMLLQAGSRFVITKVDTKSSRGHTYVDMVLTGQYPNR